MRRCAVLVSFNYIFSPRHLPTDDRESPQAIHKNNAQLLPVAREQPKRIDAGATQPGRRAGGAGATQPERAGALRTSSQAGVVKRTLNSIAAIQKYDAKQDAKDAATMRVLEQEM